MNKKFRIVGWRPFATLGMGVVSLASLIYFYTTQRAYDLQYREIRTTFDALNRSYRTLNYEILRSSLFAYSNLDVIPAELGRMKGGLARLEAHPLLGKPAYARTREDLQAFKASLEEYEEAIDDYLLFNASIKNSFVYISLISAERIKLFEKRPKAYSLIMSIIARVSQARVLLDADFLSTLQVDVAPLVSMQGLSQEQAALVRSLMIHVRFICEEYPGYVKAAMRIQNSTLEARLNTMENRFDDAANNDFDQFDRFVIVLLVLLSIAWFIVVILLIRSARENYDLRRLEEQLRFSISHDLLTGLLSRSCFEALSLEAKEPVLMLINIDHFKHVNDFYGNRFGDRILREIAALIQHKEFAEYGAQYFRLGGDDFGVLLQQVGLDEAVQMAAALKNSIESHAFHIDEIELFVTVSIGVNKTEPLIENTDLILKHEKHRRHDSIAVFSEALRLKERARLNLAVMHEVKAALEREAIVPWFQPTVCLQSGEIFRFEALARLITIDGKIKGPMHFLPAAKRTLYYYRITQAMLHHVFEAMRIYPHRFSINLGMRDLEDEKLTEMLFAALEAHRDFASRLEIELLESEELEDLALVRQLIGRLKALGCTVAIDDFGSGYSNFAYVINLDVDVLKIDGSLVSTMMEKENSYKTVESIIHFAKALHLSVVAEFVENEATAEALKRMGVQYAQGYYFGKPSAKPEAFDT